MRELISQRLWIDNAHDVGDVRHVLSLGITAIIDLAIDELPHVYPRDIIYCRLPLVDGGGNSLAVLEMAIQTAITCVNSELATLIVCSGGMSRSVAVGAAVVAAVQRQELDQALKHVALSGPHDISADLWADVKDATTRILRRTP